MAEQTIDVAVTYTKDGQTYSTSFPLSVVPTPSSKYNKVTYIDTIAWEDVPYYDKGSDTLYGFVADGTVPSYQSHAIVKFVKCKLGDTTYTEIIDPTTYYSDETGLDYNYIDSCFDSPWVDANGSIYIVLLATPEWHSGEAHPYMYFTVYDMTNDLVVKTIKASDEFAAIGPNRYSMKGYYNGLILCSPEQALSIAQWPPYDYYEEVINLNQNSANYRTTNIPDYDNARAMSLGQYDSDQILMYYFSGTLRILQRSGNNVSVYYSYNLPISGEIYCQIYENELVCWNSSRTIYVIDISSLPFVEIATVTSPGDIRTAALSPDKSCLLYSRPRSSSRYDLYSVDLSDGTQTLIDGGYQLCDIEYFMDNDLIYSSNYNYRIGRLSAE